MSISNASNADNLAIGREAISALNSAERNTATWQAKATFVLCQAYDTTLFEASVTPRTKDAETYVFSFSLDTLSRDWDNWTNGEKSAAVDLIFLKLFDVKQANDAQRMALKRVLFPAIQLAGKCVMPSEDVALTPKGALTVPYYVMNVRPDADDEAALARYTAMEDSRAFITGKRQGEYYADLVKALKPKAERGARQTTAKVQTGGKVTRETVEEALAFAFGRPALAKDIAALVYEEGGLDDLTKWVRDRNA